MYAMPLPQGYKFDDLSDPDYTEILALWARAGLEIRPEGRDSREAFSSELARSCQRIVGVRLAGHLVAVVVLTHDGRKGWVNRLAVDPAHRHLGLAQSLLAEGERWFTEALNLEVWAALIHPDNVASLTLFGRAGYQQSDIIYVSKRTRSAA